MLEPLLTYYNYARIRDDSDRLVNKCYINLVRKSFGIMGWFGSKNGPVEDDRREVLETLVTFCKYANMRNESSR